MILKAIHYLPQYLLPISTAKCARSIFHSGWDKSFSDFLWKILFLILLLLLIYFVYMVNKCQSFSLLLTRFLKGYCTLSINNFPLFNHSSGDKRLNLLVLVVMQMRSSRQFQTSLFKNFTRTKKHEKLTANKNKFFYRNLFYHNLF